MMTRGFTWVHLEFEKLEPVGHRGPMASRTASCVVADPACKKSVFWGVDGAKAAFSNAKTCWSHIDESLPQIKDSKFQPQDIEAMVSRLVALITEQLFLADVVIYAPMPEPVALLATAIAVDRCLVFAGERNRQLFVCVRVGMPDELACAHGVKISSVLRHLSANRSGSPWLITAETPGIAQHLGDFLGFDVSVQPAALPSILSAKRRYFQGSPQPARISYLGEARREKGFQYLPEIFRGFVTQRCSFRALVHAYSNSENQSADMDTARTQLAELAAQLPKESKLVVLQTAISDTSYLNTLLTTDIVLMPYAEAAYRGRGSGVLDECLGAGISVLLSHNSELYSDYCDHPQVFALDLLNPRESIALVMNKTTVAAKSAVVNPFWEPIGVKRETNFGQPVADALQWQRPLGECKDWAAVATLFEE